jgi:hypothetical protein
MRFLVAAMLLSACAGAAQAAEDCGPGCHSTAQGSCVVNGWEVGAGGWNECPAGAQPRPPCSQRYSWHKGAKACLPAN